MKKEPFKRKIKGSGAVVFIHPCSVCGKENAPFGEGVALNKNRPGKWFCSQHWKEKEMKYKSEQNNQRQCLVCKQEIPVRADGTLVTHYSDKKTKQPCPGSQRGIVGR